MKAYKKPRSKISSLAKCSNCNRSIQQQKLQIHEMMCSTAYLRQSRTSIKKQQTDMKKCMFCQSLIQKDQYQFHVERTCKHRLVPCIDCEDMFPLSLFNQHLEVCRARVTTKEEQCYQQTSNSALGSLLTGLSYVGATLYNKGAQAAAYCGKFIQQNRSPALMYLQLIRAKVEDTVEDWFMNLAYEENVEGMPRQEIRKLTLMNYQQKGQQPQTCTICICQFQQEEVVKGLKCKHLFHPTCIDKWLRINKTCPLCKMDQFQQV